MKTTRRDNITIGTPDVNPTLPSHTKGVREGNKPGSDRRQKGHRPDGRSTAARSTGINAEHRNPISPDMPNLSPA